MLVRKTLSLRPAPHGHPLYTIDPYNIWAVLLL